MRPTLAALFAVIALAASAFPQTEDNGAEEFLVLSPFSVSAGNDEYAASSTLAGTRVNTPLIDPSSANYVPNVPISIVKRAESVAIQFVLTHAGDRHEVRNRELHASIAALQAKVAETPGLRLEQREVRFTGGNRRLFSSSRGSTVSFASVIIFAELSGDARLADRVKQVRDLLQAVTLEGATKTGDGSVGLYLRNPDQYRSELLERIFADFAVLKQGLGEEFEIRPSGLNQRVRARIASETEIELWIDYSFTIHSVRELTRPVQRT